jgi:hypothetical protein
MRVTGSSSAPRTELSARPTRRRGTAAAQARVGGDRVGLGERLGRVARLVARHLEARRRRDGRLAAVAGDAQRLVDTEVADAGQQDARLDAVGLARAVDPGRDPREVLLVGEADERGMVGRGDQLDVDRAVRGAAREVLERDVRVVLGRADDARGHVVGLQEVEEVAPGEAVGGGEHAVGDAQPVALGDPAHEVRRRGALEVDVQLGLRHRHGVAPRRSSTTGRSGGASSPIV